LWWQIADRDLTQTIGSLFSSTNPVDVLEAGCGSGISSFLLAPKLNINNLTLMDISPNALHFAKQKHEENKPKINQVDFIEGDVFDLSQFKSRFDLVWNIGLIEHYQPEDIYRIISQMYRSVKNGGYLVVGIPNRKSIAVLKAAALGSKFGKRFLTWIKGYRNETEILYGKKEIVKILNNLDGIEQLQVHYAGSPMWVNAPEFSVRFCDQFFPRTRFSFIEFYSLRKVK
jgi:2-polyprenyl-3-methyl-5-hydroxy-6-metoxy-1,4-benzoquinol methylase